MADTIPDRIGREQHGSQCCQGCILGIGESPIVGALEFDPDGEIIAAALALPFGPAGVPRAPAARHELNQLAIPANEEMAGHLCVRDLAVVRMGVRIKTVGKQIDDAGTAKFSGGQADVVHDQQVDGCAIGPVVEIGGGDRARRVEHPGSVQAPRRRRLRHAAGTRDEGWGTRDMAQGSKPVFTRPSPLMGEARYPAKSGVPRPSFVPLPCFNSAPGAPSGSASSGR